MIKFFIEAGKSVKLYQVVEGIVIAEVWFTSEKELTFDRSDIAPKNLRVGHQTFVLPQNDKGWTHLSASLLIISRYEQ